VPAAVKPLQGPKLAAGGRCGFWGALDARHIRPGCQCFGNLAGSLYQNRVNDIEGAILESAFAQPLQDWPLRRLALCQQAVIHILPLLSFSLQTIGVTQIGLVGEYNERILPAGR